MSALRAEVLRRLNRPLLGEEHSEAGLIAASRLQAPGPLQGECANRRSLCQEQTWGDEMSQPSQGFAYGQLHSLSFIQLFHLCVAIARKTWFQKLAGANENHQGSQPQLVYVADIRYSSGEALQPRWARAHTG